MGSVPTKQTRLPPSIAPGTLPACAASLSSLSLGAPDVPVIFKTRGADRSRCEGSRSSAKYNMRVRQGPRAQPAGGRERSAPQACCSPWRCLVPEPHPESAIAVVTRITRVVYAVCACACEFGVVWASRLHRNA